MPRTAYLKQTSEQRCREAFEKEVSSQIIGYDERFAADLAWWMGWKHCWKYLEDRLLKEIQS